MQYLFVASGSINFFILTLIIGKKRKVKADYILGSLLFMNQAQTPFPVWKELIFEFSEASIFLYGPLLWFYTRSLRNAHLAIDQREYLHFVPFILAFIYFLSGVVQVMETSDNVRNFLLILKLLSVAGYTIWSLVLLNSHQRQIQMIFSNLDQKKLNWLRFLCWSILGIGCLAALSIMLDRFTALTIPQYGGIATNIALCVFVYILGYFGFKQEFIFRPHPNEPFEKEKYAKSGLSQDKLKRGIHQLEQHMKQKKPYLDTELTLFSLAEQLHLMPNHLSQIINSHSLQGRRGKKTNRL